MASEIVYKPIIGTKYGQWTVISEDIKRHSEAKNRTAYFKVVCQCGREGWRAAHTLVYGKTKACKSCCKTANNTNTFVQAYFNRTLARVKDKGFECNITSQYLEELFEKQNQACALSGLLLIFKPFYQLKESTASLDRIDSSKGYIQDNVQWVHKDINMMKGSLSEERFVELCKLVGNSKC